MEFFKIVQHKLIICLEVGACIGLGEVHTHGLAGTYAADVVLFLLLAAKLVDGLGTVLQGPQVLEASIGTAHHVGGNHVGHAREVELRSGPLHVECASEQHQGDGQRYHSVGPFAQPLLEVSFGLKFILARKIE